MTHPDNIDRATAEAKGYPTISAEDFELAEFLRYVHGDPDHLFRTRDPLAAPLAEGATAADVGTGV